MAYLKQYYRWKAHHGFLAFPGFPKRWIKLCYTTTKRLGKAKGQKSKAYLSNWSQSQEPVTNYGRFYFKVIFFFSHRKGNFILCKLYFNKVIFKYLSKTGILKLVNWVWKQNPQILSVGFNSRILSFILMRSSICQRENKQIKEPEACQGSWALWVEAGSGIGPCKDSWQLETVGEARRAEQGN